MYSLAPLQLQRPTEVGWFFPEGVTDALTQIKSDSSRKFLRRADEILAENNIRWEYKPLTEAEFLAWLPYYEAKMKENGFDIFANPEWYPKILGEGKTVEGFFFYKNEEMVGSCILSRIGNDRSNMNFKASEKLNVSSKTNSSIGVIIDYFYLREMVKQGVKVITSGQSRNAFGVINSVGYLEYKLRVGYQPQLPPDLSLTDEVPLNQEGYVLFFAQAGNELLLHAIVPRDAPQIMEKIQNTLVKWPIKVIEY
jgi:hypothetical protein